MGFARVKEILDASVSRWSARTGRPAVLSKHSASFGWQTRAQLLASSAFGTMLIEPDVIAEARAEDSALVIALRTGVDPYPRMPRGGPYVSDAEIAEIVDWINSGAGE